MQWPYFLKIANMFLKANQGASVRIAKSLRATYLKMIVRFDVPE